MNYNLLPWRAWAIARRRLYYACAAVGGTTILVAVLLTLIIEMHQQEKNLVQKQRQLHEAILAVSLKKSAVSTRQSAPAVHTPPGLYNILLSLASAFSDEVCFTSIHLAERGMLFHGEAPNEVALSHFLTVWPVSSVFSELRLQNLNQQQDSVSSVFEVAATLASSTQQDEDDAA